MRRSAVLVLPLLLSGCALPPIVGAVAYLADGVSYLGTGKSVSDHALSTVMDEDCATWRLLMGELICQGPSDKGKKNAIAVAAATTVYPGEAPDDAASAQTVMVAEAPQAAEPGTAARLASIAPAAGQGAAVDGEAPTLPVPAAPAAAITARAEIWSVASPRPEPVEVAAVPAVKVRTADPAMLRTRQRLLEFRKPIEMLAEHRCPGSGSAVFCPLPAAGFNG
jgi:hypothetical protein